jgi:hypothetical protein
LRVDGNPQRRPGPVEALKIHGSDLAFCVPGESYLAVLDALYDARDTIRLISCRQEGGAANMAEAYGKLTGKPGICFVTRGPGATNASIGVHTAFQDSTPMILFVGQAAQDHLDREAFQEVDFRAMFTPLAKWAAEIRDADRIPEYVARAFHVATSGRPGPVVLSLPEDVLSGECNTPATRRYQKSEPTASREAVKRAHAMLMRAENPFVVTGRARAGMRKPSPTSANSPKRSTFRSARVPRQGSLRQHASQLLRRSRNRRRSQTGEADRGQRSAARGRRAPRRNDDGGYTRLKPPVAKQSAHPCASRRQ